MSLQSFYCQGVRNLETQQITFSPQLNLLYGVNGSGKTSMLEAIHLLALGRSFRTHLLNRVINHHQPLLTIHGKILDKNNFEIPVGLQRSKEGTRQIKVANDVVPSAAELAKLLPVKVINPDSYQLLEAGPTVRRKFIDWGVFHVEHLFLECWRKCQRLLQQRNQALKQGGGELWAWDKGLVEVAEQIKIMRNEYLQQLFPIFNQVLEQLAELPTLKLSYWPGWDPESEYQQGLSQNRQRDQKQGFTQAGPHRCDLKVTCKGQPAYEVLSRGQQKVVVNSLLLAQGILLREKQQKQCIYLVDDLPAELDCKHRQRLGAKLIELEAQVFVTGIEKQELLQSFNSAPHSPTMFHVEHGELVKKF